jgi:DNA (cytosine-5)-methyltransferase 1
VENVAALLGRGIGRVLGDLAALGYDAEWHCIPAAAVGAPHIRDRVFILAYAQREQLQQWGRAGDMACTAGARESEAPQRERVWDAIGDSGADVANPPSVRMEGQRLSVEGDQRLADIDRSGPIIPNTNGIGWISRKQLVYARKSHAEGGGWWATEPDMGRVADGVPARVDRLRGLGNAVVPQVAEYIGRQMMQHERFSASGSHT